MKITFETQGNFDNSLKWLESVSKRDPKQVLKEIGSEGVKSLSSNTPRDTGQTASGWDYSVAQGDKGPEVYWYNKAHPGSRVSVAKHIDQGHGTRTGGYVQPRPYIKKAMGPVWETSDALIDRRLINP